MRLNLGSGDLPAAGWLNIDSWAGNRPDLVADITALPLPDGSAELVYCGHVLEHLWPVEVLRALREVDRVLVPAGQLCVVGPDYLRALATGDEVLVRCVAEGGDRWAGDRHLWLSHEASALSLIRKVFPSAGPLAVADLPDHWPVAFRHPVWQFAVLATKEGPR